MTKEIEFMGYTLTDDECEALHGCLMKIREKKRQERQRQACKDAISILIEDAINTIGLDETKRIVRELNRELRGNATD
jgi:uncharacterized membrane protein